MSKFKCIFYSTPRLFLIIFLFLLILTSVFANEQNVLRLSLEESVQAALKANLKLDIEQYSLKKERVSRNSSWFALLPSVSFSSSYSIVGKKLQPSPQNPGASQRKLSASLSVNTDITATLTKSIIAIVKSLEDYKVKKITFDKLMLDTAVETQKLYFSLVIARKTLRFLKEQRAVAEVDAKEAERAYRAGLRDEYAMLKTKLAFLTAKQAYDEQVNKEESARRSLLVVIGHDDMLSHVVLTDDIPDVSKFDIESILSLSSAENSSITSLRASLKSLKLDRWSAAFDYLPSFSFSYSLGMKLQNADTDNWFDGDRWNIGDGLLGFGFSIDITKYLPWSSASQKLRSLNASVNQKEQEISQLATKQGNTLSSSKLTLRRLMDALRDNETRVDIAQRAYELGQEGYKNGLITVKDYLATKAELHDAHIKRITQQAEVVKVILDIKALVNDGGGVY